MIRGNHYPYEPYYRQPVDYVCASIVIPSFAPSGDILLRNVAPGIYYSDDQLYRAHLLDGWLEIEVLNTDPQMRLEL